MSLLKTEPPAPVRTLDELFAIAHAMESEAAARYAEIATRMANEGNPALAELFARLSADEQGHLDGVVHWSERQRGTAPNPALIRWQLPDSFDDEGASTTDPRLLSAYRALAMAVRNEERAFAFWSYVAAQAESPEVQRAAETMAHEELGHVAALRRERRRAFRADRSRGQGVGAGPQAAENAASLERHLADLLEPLAAAAPLAERLRLNRFIEEARRHAQELEDSPIAMPAGSVVQGAPLSPVTVAEWLTERYLEAADGLRDEQELLRVQALAGRAIARLAWLRSDLPELENR